MVAARLAVQRHTGIQPEVAAAHTLSATEQTDMPTREETEALLEEQKTLTAEKKAKPENRRLQEINTRLKEIERKLALRKKGDALSDEEETLQRNGFTQGAAAWFADVQTMTFLGRPATVHKLLAARLEKAWDMLKDIPVPADGWVQEGHSSLRPPGQSLHSFGLAIDLNPGLNPFLLNPKDSKASLYEKHEQSQAIADIIDRASLLVLGKSPSQEAFFDKPAAPDKSARVEATYDKLAEASEALEHYLALGAEANAGELQLRVLALKAFDKDPEHRSAKAWTKAIAQDRKKLGEKASIKDWLQPETGFLHLDKRLVKAMTDTAGGGLTWLGDETIASGRDIMHFDMRGVGPIQKIYRSGQGEIWLVGG
jgi:hypothetical protein